MRVRFHSVVYLYGAMCGDMPDMPETREDAIIQLHAVTLARSVHMEAGACIGGEI